MPGLDLYLHDNYIGVVEPDRRDRRRVTLTVDADYDGDSDILLSEAFAVLPSRRPPTTAVTDFLGGYVPEGNHREQMAAKRHIDPENLFALLNEFGGSLAGAVTLRRKDEASTHRPTYQQLSDKELSAALKQAVEDSDQGIPDDSRSTLPGFQPKVLVADVDAGWSLPHGRAHSTHILKPQVPARASRIFDEYYSHQLTRHLGLSHFGSDIREVAHRTYLAIERYDRYRGSDGGVQLHHQEDLAQAMGLDWRNTDAKFQEPRWPSDPKRASVRRIAELLGSIPGGDAALENWLRQLTYHVAIGDNDAHAKNVALLHLASGTQLGPVYDALPNLFQAGRVEWNLALAIDGVFDHRKMSIERIRAEAVSWAVVAPDHAEAIITDTIRRLADALDVVEVPDGISDGLTDQLHWNVTRLLAGSEISEPKRPH